MNTHTFLWLLLLTTIMRWIVLTVLGTFLAILFIIAVILLIYWVKKWSPDL